MGVNAGNSTVSRALDNEDMLIGIWQIGAVASSACGHVQLPGMEAWDVGAQFLGNAKAIELEAMQSSWHLLSTTLPMWDRAGSMEIWRLMGSGSCSTRILDSQEVFGRCDI